MSISHIMSKISELDKRLSLLIPNANSIDLGLSSGVNNIELELIKNKLTENELKLESLNCSLTVVDNVVKNLVENEKKVITLTNDFITMENNIKNLETSLKQQYDSKFTVLESYNTVLTDKIVLLESNIKENTLLLEDHKKKFDDLILKLTQCENNFTQLTSRVELLENNTVVPPPS